MYFVIYIVLCGIAFTLSLMRGHDVKESYVRAPLGPLYIVYAMYQILAGDKHVYVKDDKDLEKQENKEQIVIKL